MTRSTYDPGGEEVKQAIDTLRYNVDSTSHSDNKTVIYPVKKPKRISTT